MNIDIIIVNYHSEDKIIECIRSIEKNIDIPFNIYIADNNENITKWNIKQKNIHIFKMKGNIGFSKACNKMVDLSDAEYIFFINPDIKLISPINSSLKILNKENCILAAQLLNPKKKIILSIMNYYSILGAFYELKIVKKFLFRKKVSRNKIFKVPSVHFACCIMKREIFLKLNGFNEKYFMYFEDMDLCYRALKNNIITYYDPKFKAIHLQGYSSNKRKTFSLLHNYRGRYIFIKSNYGYFQYILLFSWNLFKILIWYIINCFAILIKLIPVDTNCKINGLLKLHLYELKKIIKNEAKFLF